MFLALYNDKPSSQSVFQELHAEDLLKRLRALDVRIHTKGFAGLNPKRDPLVRIGTEWEGFQVTKSGYGVLDLSWQTDQHARWAQQIEDELEQLREGISKAHGTKLRFLIWAGMGGSAEDKNAYAAAGLLKKGPRCYVLDSTDPAKLKGILADMQRRSRKPLAELLASTLVVGMAMGMTSYEPVVNLQRLAELYDSLQVASQANFLYMTLPGSLLDQFASKRGYRRVELQPDSRNSTAGRHSAPLTRGSLYPLALSGVDLGTWMRGSVLTEEEVLCALKLAAFLHSQGVAGRDKVTLLLSPALESVALWTKQDFEESLGKSDALGIKIVIGEKPKLAHYRSPKEASQDRLFLNVQLDGEKGDAAKTALLRRAGYPVSVVKLRRGAMLSHYMQFMHYAVFALGYLRNMNFVTQPGVELYKSITNRLYAEARKRGGLDKTDAWADLRAWPCALRWRKGVTLYAHEAAQQATAPEQYAAILKDLIDTRAVSYGELTFFGDTRYSAKGRTLRSRLNRAGDILFRSALKMPVDVYEGPAMNHSYHEMIIGHGHCFSTVLLCETAETLDEIDYSPEYHRAQFLATLLALRERKRPVVAILLRDLEPSTLTELDEFFRQAARHAKG